jgi:hypothetical protein
LEFSQGKEWVGTCEVKKIRCNASTPSLEPEREVRLRWRSGAETYK